MARRGAAGARRPARPHRGQRRCVERCLLEPLQRRAGVGAGGQAVLRPQRAGRRRRRARLRESGRRRDTRARAWHEQENGEAGDQRSEQRQLAAPPLQPGARAPEARAERSATIGERQRSESARSGEALRGLELERGRHPGAEPEVAIEQARSRGGAGGPRDPDREHHRGQRRAPGMSQTPAPLLPVASAPICMAQAAPSPTSAARRSSASRRRRSTRSCQRRTPRAIVRPPRPGAPARRDRSGRHRARPPRSSAAQLERRGIAVAHPSPCSHRIPTSGFRRGGARLPCSDPGHLFSTSHPRPGPNRRADHPLLAGSPPR